MPGLKGLKSLKEAKGLPKTSRWLYIAVASAAVVLLVVAATFFLVSPEGSKATITMNRGVCESSGGTWNECGSPCIGAPQGTVCIQACREQCEWYAGSAELARKSSLASQPGFGCMTQDNGVLMCWLPRILEES